MTCWIPLAFWGSNPCCSVEKMIPPATVTKNTSRYWSCTFQSPEFSRIIIPRTMKPCLPPLVPSTMVFIRYNLGSVSGTIATNIERLRASDHLTKDYNICLQQTKFSQLTAPSRSLEILYELGSNFMDAASSSKPGAIKPPGAPPIPIFSIFQTCLAEAVRAKATVTCLSCLKFNRHVYS